MDKRNFLAAGASVATVALFAGCTTSTGESADPAARRRSIDAGANEALARLYKEAAGSQELVRSARGVLIFPSFVSAGFIVGGAHGQGVLRKGGTSAGFFSMTEGSVGFLAGAQSQAVFILFMTQEALAKFEASNGWTAGVDGSVALINVGATASVSTQTAQQSIVGFMLTNSGLMANASLNGSRISRLAI